MPSDFGAAMRQALNLVRSQDVMEATRVIQRALVERTGAAPAREPGPAGPSPALPPPAGAAPHAGPAEAARGRDAARPQPTGRMRRPLGEVVRLLGQAGLPGLARGAAETLGLRKAPPVSVPEDAAWLSLSYASAAGSRDYKLFVPGRAKGRALPLVVMLHGCTQNPDDFAAGTGMNALAEEMGFLVAYPQQPGSANRSACWNWFERAHQTRQAGEPAILAGLTRSVVEEFAVDPARVYVAGLSAGGAMAAILAATWPDLFAAVGVHSGLPHGAAGDLPSGLMAMRGGGRTKGGGRPGAGRRVRTIVFHGASDRVVNPVNGDAILAEARAFAGAQETIVDGVAGGRAFTRTIVTDARGTAQAERWSVEGLGHAWSGGSPDGSFADPAGPSASREMARFFLETAGR